MKPKAFSFDLDVMLCALDRRWVAEHGISA